MSDADEFDKEAERERLREKYEADQADREATQRMSELLLQGATMTNRHCEHCGDPVFRHEGREFCPSCGAAAGGGDATGAGPTDGPAADDGSEDAPGTTAEESGEADRGGTPPATHPGEGPAPDPDRPGDRGSAAGPDDAAAAPTASQADAGGPRAALAATATRMARRADAAEDPRQAREWLAAAREAAAALAALDGRAGDGG